MKIVSSKNKWWVGSENQWAYKDKLGDWWIFNRKAPKNDNTLKTPKTRKKQKEKSIPMSWDGLLGFVYFVILGVSVSLNIYQYMVIKVLSK